MAPIQKQILRVKDVYKELDCAIPLSSLYRIIVFDKKLAYFRVGRAICITRESFEAFMADGSGK
jgi:hypothetical protein